MSDTTDRCKSEKKGLSSPVPCWKLSTGVGNKRGFKHTQKVKYKISWSNIEEEKLSGNYSI